MDSGYPLDGDFVNCRRKALKNDTRDIDSQAVKSVFNLKMLNFNMGFSRNMFRKFKKPTIQWITRLHSLPSVCMWNKMADGKKRKHNMSLPLHAIFSQCLHNSQYK